MKNHKTRLDPVFKKKIFEYNFENSMNFAVLTFANDESPVRLKTLAVFR